MPPSLAMAMAMRDSVTVSIPALTKGMFNLMFLENRVVMSTSEGRTSEASGTNKTSSKVMPSRPNLS